MTACSLGEQLGMFVVSSGWCKGITLPCPPLRWDSLGSGTVGVGGGVLHPISDPSIKHQTVQHLW